LGLVLYYNNSFKSDSTFILMKISQKNTHYDLECTAGEAADFVNGLMRAIQENVERVGEVVRLKSESIERDIGEVTEQDLSLHGYWEFAEVDDSCGSFSNAGGLSCYPPKYHIGIYGNSDWIERVMARNEEIATEPCQ
jgi:hypothetical protein